MKVWQKILVMLCTGLILFPSAVDLAHVFSGHKHDFCNHYAESHVHQKTIDCELFHFQKQIFSLPPVYTETFVDAALPVRPPKREYLYISAFQKLHFSLRAPPAAV